MEYPEAEIPTSVKNFCDIHEDNIIVGPRTRQQVAKASSNTIPRSFYEVTLSQERDSWMHAFNQEVQSLENTAGMRVVSRPKNTFIIPVRILFEVKYDNLLKVTKKKCRIVARGDVQKRFLGKKAKFSAPVSSPVALKLLLIYSFECETFVQLDIKTAFLYGRLTVGKYFELPAGC